MAPFDVANVIAEFVMDSNRNTLTLPQMTTGQRKSAKKLVDQYPELGCKNEGQGSDRRLYIFKVFAAIDQDYSKDFLLGWDDQQQVWGEDDEGWDDQQQVWGEEGWDDAGSSKAVHQELSKNLLLAYRAVSMDAEAPGFGYKASDPPVPERKAVDVAPDAPIKNPMDNLLRDCFLQAIKTNQITKQLSKGMPSKGSRIYAECMKPCRPVGTSIDVKTSSFSGVRRFFEHLETQGLLELRPGLPDPVVTNFFWNHPDILNFSPWPLATTVQGKSDESAPSVRSRLVAAGEAAPSVRCAQKSAKDSYGVSDGLKDKSSFHDVLRRIPSPSKARARHQH